MSQNVIVIGGGVVGMSCAYELARRGVSVTVIDKGSMGHGCSYGNAGWITPCFAMPLPMPGMFFKSLGWLMDPDGPLYIKPSADPLLVRWLTRFLFSMNRRQMNRSVAALTEVSKYSLNAYAALDREFDGSFSFQKKGLLMACQTRQGLDYALQEMELVAKQGIPGKQVSPEALRELEPAVVGKTVGGVYFPNEAHAEPLQVVESLTKAAERHGARILNGTEVFDFEMKGRVITGLQTTRGPMKADRYVLATGFWSTRLAKRIKINVPVLGGKGYALIVDPFEQSPRIPLMLLEKKIAVTPRAGSVRIAGTLELVNGDESITPRRVRAILRGARQFLNLPESPRIHEVWRGLRPCTPDGVPIVDHAPAYDNLMVLTGHQMLGLQSAPGSARLAADLLLGTTPTFDPKPFRANRF